MYNKGALMKKIFRGWYKETHLGDIAIEGTDIIEMNQEAYEKSLFSFKIESLLITISVLTFENIILRKGEIIKTNRTTANKDCLGTNYLLLKRKSI